MDFWTYSCINCQRTLPYLKGWWEKYKDKGLVIIGVHTPEFEFEKEVGNVKKALKTYGVEWPVVLDNDYTIWDSYANHYWPAKYLIDHEGKIIYTHFGEGNYAESELEIQQALVNAGFKVSDKLSGSLVQESAQYGQTPELYFGSQRGYLLKAPKDSQDFEPDQIYIQGEWRKEKEYLEHPNESQELEDVTVLKYRAKKVYLVMESSSGASIKVYVTLDGVGLKDNGAGADIQFDKEDRSFVEVKFSTLYNLVDKDSFGEHILRISTLEKGLRLFAFTFGN